MFMMLFTTNMEEDAEQQRFLEEDDCSNLSSRTNFIIMAIAVATALPFAWAYGIFTKRSASVHQLKTLIALAATAGTNLTAVVEGYLEFHHCYSSEKAIARLVFISAAIAAGYTVPYMMFLGLLSIGFGPLDEGETWRSVEYGALENWFLLSIYCIFWGAGLIFTFIISLLEATSDDDSVPFWVLMVAMCLPLILMSALVYCFVSGDGGFEWPAFDRLLSAFMIGLPSILLGAFGNSVLLLLGIGWIVRAVDLFLECLIDLFPAWYSDYNVFALFGACDGCISPPAKPETTATANPGIEMEPTAHEDEPTALEDGLDS